MVQYVRIVLALVLLNLVLRTVSFAQESPANGRELAAAMEELVVAAVAKAEKSVVAVARVRKDDSAAGFQVPTLTRLGIGRDEPLPTDVDFVPSAFGAGVVIGRGLVATTYHVIGNVKESTYYVWSQNRPFRAQVIAADGWFDLAVLKVDAPDLEPIPFADTKSLKKGEFVVALGNPQAIGRDGRPSAAWGIVSNLMRRAPRVGERSNDPSGRETVHHYGTLIQVDAKLDLGFSGGALLNLSGEMVGMTTAYAGGPGEAQAAGFAIPVNEHFHQALEQLKAGKSPEFGFLGVGPLPLELRLRQQGHHGTYVETVLPGTPASRADIQPGDIITHADGEPLYDDDDLIRVVGSLPPERTIRVAVYRGDLLRRRGELLNKEVTLAKKRVSTLRPSFSIVSPPAWRGIQVDYSSVGSRDVTGQAQLPTEECVYVVDVAAESAAWKAGIRKGMFLARVADEPVATPREFFAAVADLRGDVPVQLFDSNGTTTILTISP